MEKLDFSEYGLPIRLPRSVRVNSARTVAEGVVQPAITSKELKQELVEITGKASEEFRFSTRVFEFVLQENDYVIMQSVENGFPLIVFRDGEVILNFDIWATQAHHFVDTKRPIYTYIPGFHIQKIPPLIRRPLSNFVHSVISGKGRDVVQNYGNLPLTSFEFIILVLNKLMARDTECETRVFQWPSGKRAVFISIHDVDTGGFLRRRESDPLFRLEQKHQIHSTWFVPTGLLTSKETVDFLLQTGNEVGWHGHKHDHRLPFKPYADQRVHILRNSFLSEPENFPTGMRTPKLQKSNYLFDLLDRSCPALRYDTSFSKGIVPYYLWVNGRQSRILEIPTTVPTDIGVYHKLSGLPRSLKFETILDAQVARTKKLIEVGGIISIETHPEKDLSERPEFLEIYDRYLSYIKSCPDIWFATAGELYKYWMRDSQSAAKRF